MKWFNIFFLVLFIVSAVLQWNDPDPYIWMPLYLYGAFLCLLAVNHTYHPKMYAAGLLVYTGYAGYLFFSDTGVYHWINEHEAENIVQSMKATRPWIEETREFFGLLLLIIALAANMLWFRNRRSSIHSYQSFYRGW